MGLKTLAVQVLFVVVVAVIVAEAKKDLDLAQPKKCGPQRGVEGVPEQQLCRNHLPEAHHWTSLHVRLSLLVLLSPRLLQEWPGRLRHQGQVPMSLHKSETSEEGGGGKRSTVAERRHVS
ncbi:hypothetical protein HPB49_018779 [Dermacentor silvarum]|uniref:Uncharacterized protein n=1 Tax=Dermacentor silvarum TaxID=543639 RepID=A0ACB8CSP0_DERSI|nr:uncharacterized protein LOC119452956 [Dermacentor silvarum]KAH7950028.1 hypothetical protein HPB49_018779 [Dermacentor silvarum]